MRKCITPEQKRKKKLFNDIEKKYNEKYKRENAKFFWRKLTFIRLVNIT